MTKKIFVFKEKLLILSWETCRWALSCSSWWSWPANGCCFKCALLFSSQWFSYDHLPFLFHSLPSSQKTVGKQGHPGWLCFIPQPPCQTCPSLKQAKWKKLSVFWNTNIINTVLCNRLLTVNLSWQDVQTVLTFLTRCTDLIRKMEKEKNEGDSWKQHCVP